MVHEAFHLRKSMFCETHLADCTFVVQALKVGDRMFPVVSNDEKDAVVEVMELTGPDADYSIATHKGRIIQKAHVQVRYLRCVMS